RIFAIHSILGLITGILLLVISLSGCILVFHEEIDKALNPPLLCVKPGQHKTSLDKIFKSASHQFPGSYIRFRHLPANPEASIELSVQKQSVWIFAYYNPYNGDYLGSRNARNYFLGWLLGLHYGLLAGSIGELLVGILSVCLLLSLLTGVYVYRKHLLNVLMFRITFKFSNWRKASSSLHRIIGVWSLLFNLMFAVTGFWMLRYVFQPSTYQATVEPKSLNDPVSVSLDSVVKTAETTFDGFKVSGIHLPKTKEESINIIGAVSTQNILYGEHANSIEFDPLTGKELSRIDVTKQSAYDKWDSIVFPLHSGLFGNIIVKLIYCVAGLSPSLLSITGFLLWLRRRRR
ncbi:MAG TPA: PepSY-associated TM helix domain-containing protein, partial [Pedobacter sp.]